MNQGNDLYRLIDYTCLKASATVQDLDLLVEGARECKFNSICIRSSWISRYASQYRTSSVIGFPVDIFSIESSSDLVLVRQQIGKINILDKLAEMKQACLDGALELDPVLDLDNIERELNAYILLLNSLQFKQEIFLKPIFSCELLSEKEIETSIKIFANAVDLYLASSQGTRIRFSYKNSTGFVKSESVELHKTSVELIHFISSKLDKYDPEKRIGIKAAGGIRSLEEVLKIREASSGRLTHIGTSSILK